MTEHITKEMLVEAVHNINQDLSYTRHIYYKGKYYNKEEFEELIK